MIISANRGETLELEGSDTELIHDFGQIVAAMIASDILTAEQMSSFCSMIASKVGETQKRS